MSEYPQSWAECETGEVLKVVGGGTPPSHDPNNFAEEGGTPWVTPADLSGYKRKYIARGRRNLTAAGMANSSAKVMPAGSVLFSSRAPVGYVAIAENALCTSQGFKSFLVPSGFDSSYLYYYLRYITPEAEARATGTTFKELSGSAAAKLPLLVAPCNEQVGIARKLDAVLARVDACRERLEGVPQVLKKFREAVLEAAVSGRLTEEWRKSADAPAAFQLIGLIDAEQIKAGTRRRRGVVAPERGIFDASALPAGWIIAGLDAIAAPEPNALKAGPFGSSLKKSMYSSNGYKIYGQEQVLAENEKIGDYFIDETKYRELASCAVKPGDILVSLVGTIGKVLVLSDRCAPGIINPRLVKLSLHRLINRRYIVLYLRSPAVQRFFTSRSHGGTMEILNLRLLREVPIVIPPLDEQSEIVRRVDALLALADDVKLRYEAGTSRLEKLVPAVLAKAFRGDLVPQDPSDEPAEALLRRIRQGNGSGGVSRQSKKATGRGGVRRPVVKAYGAHPHHRRSQRRAVRRERR